MDTIHRIIILVFLVPLYSDKAFSDRVPLSIEKALEMSFQANDRLKSIQLEYKRQSFIKDQSGRYLNPEIGFEYTKNANEDEMEISLSQEFELGGKISSKVNQAKIMQQLAKLDYEIERSAVAARAKILYHETYAFQEKLQLLRETLQSFKDVLKIVRRNLKNGAISQVEVTRAKLAILTLETKKRKIEQLYRIKLNSLSHLMGKGKFSSFHLTSNPGPFSNFINYQNLEEKLLESPLLLKSRVLISLNSSKLEIEKANSIPNLTIGASYIKNRQTNEQSYGISFSIPLPVANRNQGLINSENLALTQERYNHSETKRELTIKLFELSSNIQNLIEEVKNYKNIAIPEANSMYKEVEALYKRGKQSYLVLSTIQKELIEIKMAYLDSIAELYIKIVKIEELLGNSLSTTNKGE